MATYTTRLNATKAASSENVDVTTHINNAFDLFDAAVGATVASAASLPASAFSGRFWYESDTGLLKVNTAASASTAATWRRPQGEAGVIYVSDYFSSGRTEGVTDDSTAVINARNAVLASRGVGGNLPSMPILRFPPGLTRVVTPDALFAIGGSLTRGYAIEGSGYETSTVVFDPAGASATNASMNMITASGTGPQLAGLRIRNICFHSVNANASFAYLFSTTSAWIQDTLIDNVRFAGTWKRIIGLDGDSDANLNSEMTFNRVVTSSASFSDSFMHSGITNPASTANQDQFLNYWFHDCKMEQATGNTLLFDKGGSIVVNGGSWIIGDAGTGTHFKMGNYDHASSVCNLLVQGVRFELRNQNQRVIDCAWRENGHVTFINCNDDSSAYLHASNATGTGASANWDTHVYRTPTAGGTRVKYQDCSLMGYHRVETTATQPIYGKWIYDNCTFANMNFGGAATLAAASGQFFRYDSAAPHYRYMDCTLTTDANT